jgi:hypothetical protein
VAKVETKSVRFHLTNRGDKKKLEKLLKDGWVVASQTTRGLAAYHPGATDIVLTREK